MYISKSADMLSDMLTITGKKLHLSQSRLIKPQLHTFDFPVWPPIVHILSTDIWVFC